MISSYYKQGHDTRTDNQTLDSIDSCGISGDYGDELFQVTGIADDRELEAEIRRRLKLMV